MFLVIINVHCQYVAEIRLLQSFCLVIIKMYYLIYNRKFDYGTLILLQFFYNHILCFKNNWKYIYIMPCAIFGYQYREFQHGDSKIFACHVDIGIND